MFAFLPQLTQWASPLTFCEKKVTTLHGRRISRQLKREIKKTVTLLVMALLLLGICIVLVTTDLSYRLWHGKEVPIEPTVTPKPAPVYIITGEGDNMVVDKIEIQDNSSETRMDGSEY